MKIDTVKEKDVAKTKTNKTMKLRKQKKNKTKER